MQAKRIRIRTKRQGNATGTINLNSKQTIKAKQRYKL
jgi:hypothetical protein